MTARSWLLPSCLLPFIAGAVGHLLTPTRFPRQATPSSSRPILVFNDLQNVVVCSPQLISWFYSGPVAPLGLSVTNDGVNQQSSSQARPTPTFTDSGVKVSRRGLSLTSSTIELASSLDPTNKAFVWPVTIPQGWYILTAVIPDASYYTTSARFFVRDAGNASCGVVFSSSSSSITSQTTAAASPSTAPSQTSITPPTGATSSAVNVAAIAGGVAGGVALLLLSLFLYIFFVCRPRRSHALPRSRSTSSPSGKGSGLGPSPGSSWGGLGSVDCHAAMGMPSTPKKSHRTARQASHTESFATFVDTAPVEPKYGSPSQEDVLSSRSRRGSVTQPAWYGSPPSEEKLGGSVEEMELEGVPTLGYPINKANLPHHSLSTSTFASELTMGNMGPQRHPSVSSHLPAPIMDTVRDLPTSVPTSLMTSPASPPPPATQQQRKPARKPVPVYSPSLDGGPRADAQPESPLPPPPPIAATNSTGIYSPVAGSPPATGGGGGHYSTRGNRRSIPPIEKASGRSKSKTRILGAGSSCESVVDGGESNVKSNGLVHKNSFGPGGVEGKPLHYLVPDILPRG